MPLLSLLLKSLFSILNSRVWTKKSNGCLRGTSQQISLQKRKKRTLLSSQPSELNTSPLWIRELPRKLRWQLLPTHRIKKEPLRLKLMRSQDKLRKKRTDSRNSTLMFPIISLNSQPSKLKSKVNSMTTFQDKNLLWRNLQWTRIRLTNSKSSLTFIPDNWKVTDRNLRKLEPTMKRPRMKSRWEQIKLRTKQPDKPRKENIKNRRTRLMKTRPNLIYWLLKLLNKRSKEMHYQKETLVEKPSSLSSTEWKIPRLHLITRLLGSRPH